MRIIKDNLPFIFISRYLEDYLNFPVIWLACRHHVMELHIGRLIQAVTGDTKDPGVALFRRFKASYLSLNLDPSKFVCLDLSTKPEWMQKLGTEILEWAKALRRKNTFPRADYAEFLSLVIYSLGGDNEDFTMMMPGPDHHARWMSDCLYFPKIAICRDIFSMSTEELGEVTKVTEFVVLFYARFWFESPLASAAARNDISFMLLMLQYRTVEPRLAFIVLQSHYRHLWYLAGQTIVFALVDPGLDEERKEELALAMHSMTRKPVEQGKPGFPDVVFEAGWYELPSLGSFITEESWLSLTISD